MNTRSSDHGTVPSTAHGRPSRGSTGTCRRGVGPWATLLLGGISFAPPHEVDGNHPYLIEETEAREVKRPA